MKWTILLLFLLMLLPRLFESKPDYSDRFTNEYNIMKTTSILENRYFVRPDFS